MSVNQTQSARFSGCHVRTPLDRLVRGQSIETGSHNILPYFREQFQPQRSSATHKHTDGYTGIGVQSTYLELGDPCLAEVLQLSNHSAGGPSGERTHTFLLYLHFIGSAFERNDIAPADRGRFMLP